MTLRMKNFFLLLVASLVCMAHVSAEPTAVLPLANLFDPGVILKDRNGDEVIDFVDARIGIGEQATAADIADLERDVGYRPSTSIEDGIQRFVDWYRDYYGK